MLHADAASSYADGLAIDVLSIVNHKLLIDDCCAQRKVVELTMINGIYRQTEGRGSRPSQQAWPPVSAMFTQVPLAEGQHIPLQCPAEPGGPAHPQISLSHGANRQGRLAARLHQGKAKR